MQLFYGISEKNILILRSFKIENQLSIKPMYFFKQIIHFLKTKIKYSDRLKHSPRYSRYILAVKSVIVIKIIKKHAVSICVFRL